MLRQLLNEDYNKILNAQLLSRVYVEEKDRLNYDLLANRVNPKYLIPFTDSSTEEFFSNQKEILLQKVDLIFEQFKKKYEVRFNKTIPLLLEKEYPDSFFMKESEDNRNRIIEATFLLPKKRNEYLDTLNNTQFMYRNFEVLNDMVQSSSTLGIGDMDFLSVSISHELASKKDLISNIQNEINQQTFKSYVDSFNYELITKDYYNNFIDCIQKQINNLKNMNDLVGLESSFRSFCLQEEIPEPELLFDQNYSREEEYTQRYFIDPVKIFGDDFVENKRKIELKEEMKKIVESFASGIANSDKTSLLYSDSDLDCFFSDKKRNNAHASIRSDVIAVLDFPNGFLGSGDNDLYLATKGIYLKKTQQLIQYSEANNERVAMENKKLRIGKQKYGEKEVNTMNLYNLIQELRTYVTTK